MTLPKLIIYDDDRGRFGPMKATRAVFELRTGAHKTQKRIRQVTGLTEHALFVPEDLCHLVRSRYPGIHVNPDTIPSGLSLLINGRWPAHRYHEQVNSLSPGQALVQTDGGVIAAQLDVSDVESFIQSGFTTLPDNTATIRAQERVLIDRPWHILDALPEVLLHDLQANDQPRFNPENHPGVTLIGDHPVRAADDALVMPTSVIDASQGPVWIDRGATVHPLALLQGPCCIGPHATVVSHANIRANTVIGHHCKVGGEVSASILQAFSNKSHHGYLGDSLVGAWVNLGAGTNLSNLKNTYGNVRVRLDDTSKAEDTGRTFHGAIIGDYVRTAISTRIPTGAVIHTACMLAGSGWAPKLAMPLGFYDDSGRQPYDPDRLIQTLSRIKARRNRTLSDAMQQRILDLAAQPV